MEGSLKDVNVAILAVDGFEQVELTRPREALAQQGARTALVSAAREPILGMHHIDKGDRFDVDLIFSEARAADFDAVLLPGGVVNADEIRMHPAARDFVRAMQEQGKVIAVICHGPWLLASADLLRGRTLTSWPSVQDDLRNAGAHWIDQEVVVDGNLVSSRKPDDIPAFNREMLRVIGAHR